MALACPKCAKAVSEDAVYCPYCGYGLKPSAKTVQVSLGASLIIVATAASLILFMLSVKALMQIYVWYPQVVAQNWIIYDQMFAFSTLVSFLFGLASSVLLLLRRNFRLSITLTSLLTVSCVAAWIISIVEPFTNLGSSFFYFFLPLVLPALIGTLLVYPRKAEFDQKIKRNVK
jgi:RNA polymerase subunit RPABC4/transcription elongation factor Spt4